MTLKADLIEDLRALQDAYPDQRITRNFYRCHGHYKESQWQYYFPTFSSFLATIQDSLARYIPQEDVYSAWIDTTSYDIGDVLLIGGTRCKIVAKGPAAIRTKRQYWYHDLLDWLSSLRKQQKAALEKAPNHLPQ